MELSRRSILLALVLALALPATGAAARPNVLLIVSDDQAVSTLPNMRATPNRFDVNYPHGFVTTPLCCPSRASIFSGKLEHNHGIDTNDGRGFDATQTWVRYLHDAGYRLGLVGKYLNLVDASDAPYFDFKIHIPYGSPKDAILAARYADQFLTSTEAADARPWALVVAGTSPHIPFETFPQGPYHPPPYNPVPSVDEADRSDKAQVVQDVYPDPYTPDGRFLHIWRGQSAEVAAIDQEVAKVIARLNALGEGGRTLRFYMSDNGYQMGEHRLYSKRWPYQESIQVPMLMSYPPVTDKLVDPRIAENIDIAPTIFDAAGIEPGYQVDGRSLLEPDTREWLFTESDGGTDRPTWRGYWTPERHYIRWSDGFVEDYDLAADPWETAASNVPDPAIELQLAVAASCVGTSCP